jgi:hypothetical protein
MLPVQYAKFSTFSGIGVVGKWYIRTSELFYLLKCCMAMYIVYKFQNYTDVIRKCADMSMSRAVEEIKVSQIYGVIGGEVCICMHVIYCH